jgi:hypothetical protein
MNHLMSKSQITSILFGFIHVVEVRVFNYTQNLIITS